MAKNIASYIANIGKSIGYVAVERVEQKMPAMKEFADTNNDLFKTIYHDVRYFNQTYQRTLKTFKGSKVYEAGTVLKESLFEDIKNGTFYNKKRADDSSRLLGNMDTASDWDTGFDESDMSGYDFDTNDFDNEPTESEANAKAISMAVAKSAEYVVESGKENTNLLYLQNTRGFEMIGTGLDNINKNISNLSQLPSLLSTQAENQKTFYETIGATLGSMNDTLQAIREAVAPTKQEKKKRERIGMEDVLGSEGSLNISNYLKVIKQNLSNLTGGISSTLNMFGDDSNMLAELASQPLRFIPEKIVNTIIPKTIDKSMEELDKSISGLFASMIRKFNDMANDDDNIIKSYIGKTLQVKNTVNSRVETKNYEKGNMSWNGKANKALLEVIPTYLRKILSAIDGKDEMVYDYESGRFTSAKNIHDGFKSYRKSSVRTATGDMKEAMMRNLDALSFNSYDERKRIEEAIDSVLENVYSNGKIFDANGRNKNSAMEYGLDDRTMKIIQGLFRNTSKSLQLQFNKSIIESRESLNKLMESFGEKGDSIYTNLFNGSNMNSYVPRDKDGKIRENKTLAYKNSALNVKDELNHSGFYYLQNIYKELMWIRKSNIISGGGYSGGSSYNPDYKNLNGVTTKVRLSDGSYTYMSDGISIKDIKIPDKSNRDVEANRRMLQRQRDNDRYLENEKKRMSKNKFIHNISDIDDKHLASNIDNIIKEMSVYNDVKENSDEEKSLLDKLYTKMMGSDKLSEKGKSVASSVQEIMNKPVELMDRIINKVNLRMYELIYGRKNEDGSETQGMLKTFKNSVTGMFTNINDWVEDNMLSPIKEKLGIEKFSDLKDKFLEKFGLTDVGKRIHDFFLDKQDGLFPRIKDSIKDTFSNAFDNIKQAFSNVFAPLKDKFGRKDRFDRLDNESDDNIEDLLAESQSNAMEATPVEPPKHFKNKTEQRIYEVENEIKRLTNENNNLARHRRVISVRNKIRNNKDRIAKLKEELKKLKDKKKRLEELEKERSRRASRANRSLEEQLLSGTLSSENEEVVLSEYNKRNGTSYASPMDIVQSKINRNSNKMNTWNDKAKYLLGIMNDTEKSGNREKELMRLLGDDSISDKDKEKYKHELYQIKNAPKLYQNMERLISGLAERELSLKEKKEELEKRDRDRAANPVTTSGKTYHANHRLKEADINRQLGRVEVDSNSDDVVESVAAPASGNVFVEQLKYIKNISNILTRFANALKGRSNVTDSGIIKSTTMPNMKGFSPSESGAANDFATRLAQVISQFIHGNVPFFAEGSAAPLQDSTVAVVGKNEVILTEDQVNSIKELFGNVISGGVKRVNKGTKRSKIARTASAKTVNLLSNLTPKQKSQVIPTLINMVNGYDYGDMDELSNTRLKKDLLGALSDAQLSKEELKEKRKAGIQEPEFNIAGLIKDETISALKETKEALFPSNPERERKTFGEVMEKSTEKISTYIPDMIASGLLGGGVSLLTGAIGGPLLGAAVGAGIGLTKNSESVQNWLFGTKMNDGTRKDDGFFTAEFVKKAKKYLPDMKSFGIVGGIAGLMPFLPFGPITGLLLGGTTGYLKNNEEFRQAMFGKDDGILSDENKAKLKSILPKAGAGALLSAIFSPLPFGIMGNALIGAGTGLLATTDTFKELVLGTKDKDGKYQDGLLPAIRDTIINPLENGMEKLRDTIGKFIKDNILSPIKSAMKPIGQQMLNIGNTIKDSIKEGIKNSFENGLGVPIKKLVEKMLSPVKKVAGGIFKGGTKVFGKVISAPFKTIGHIGEGLRRKQIKNGTAAYMTARERVDYRDTHDTFGATGRDRYSKFDQNLAVMSQADPKKLEKINKQIKFIQSSKNDLENERRKKLKALANHKFVSSLGYDKAVQLQKAIDSQDMNRVSSLVASMGSDIDPELANQYLNEVNKYGKFAKDMKDKTGINDEMIATLRKMGVKINSKRDLTNISKLIDTEVKANKDKEKAKPVDINKEYKDKVIDKFDSIIDILASLQKKFTGVDNEADKKDLRKKGKKYKRDKNGKLVVDMSDPLTRQIVMNERRAKKAEDDKDKAKAIAKKKKRDEKKARAEAEARGEEYIPPVEDNRTFKQKVKDVIFGREVDENTERDEKGRLKVKRGFTGGFAHGMVLAGNAGDRITGAITDQLSQGKAYLSGKKQDIKNGISNVRLAVKNGAQTKKRSVQDAIADKIAAYNDEKKKKKEQDVNQDNFLDKLVSKLRGDKKPDKKKKGGIFSKIIGTIKGIFGVATGGLGLAGGLVKGVFGSGLGLISKLIPGGILGKMVLGIGAATGLGLVPKLKEFFDGTFKPWITEKALPLMHEKIIPAVQSGMETITKTILGLIPNLLKGAVTFFRDTVVPWFNKDGVPAITQGAKILIQAVPDLIAGVTKFLIKDGIPLLWDLGKAIVVGVKNGIKDVFHIGKKEKPQKISTVKSDPGAEIEKVKKSATTAIDTGKDYSSTMKYSLNSTSSTSSIGDMTKEDKDDEKDSKKRKRATIVKAATIGDSKSKKKKKKVSKSSMTSASGYNYPVAADGTWLDNVEYYNGGNVYTGDTVSNDTTLGDVTKSGIKTVARSVVTGGATGSLGKAVRTLSHPLKTAKNGAKWIGKKVLNKMNPEKAEKITNFASKAKKGAKAIKSGWNVVRHPFQTAENLLNGKTVAESAEAIAEGGKKGFLKNTKNVYDLATEGVGKIGDAIDKKSPQVAQKIGNAFKSLKSKVVSKSVKEGAEDLAENAVEKKGVISGIIKKFTKMMGKILNSKIVQKFVSSKVVKKISESAMPQMVKVLKEEMTKRFKTLSEKAAAKVAGLATGGLLNIAFAVADFVSGWNDAMNILGITEEPTIGMKFICGLIRAVNGLFVVTSFIPEKFYVNLFMDFILPCFGKEDTKLQKMRDKARSEVEKYNEEHGTDYSVEDYNEEVGNTSGIFSKIKKKLKGKSTKKKKSSKKKSSSKKSSKSKKKGKKKKKNKYSAMPASDEAYDSYSGMGGPFTGIGGTISGIQTGTSAINSATEGYRKTVDQLKGRYGVKDTDLVLAMMMQESGGGANGVKDVMQSSESLGMAPNTIQDPIRSIEAGLKLLGSNLSQTDDVATAVQAYNYGPGFISYVKKHGGKYTHDLAVSFSNQHGGNYGDKDYVPHVFRYYKGNGASAGTGTTDSSTDSSAESKPTLSGFFSDLGTAFSSTISKMYGFDDGSGSTSGAASTSTAVPAGSQAEKAIAVAKSFLGSPYVFGGTTPPTKVGSEWRGGGFDCSALMQYAYDQADVKIGRTTYDQINNGKAVGSISQAKPGDLLLFGTRSDPHHVGMYLGNDKYIHAPKTGDVVKISNVSGRNDLVAIRNVTTDGSGGPDPSFFGIGGPAGDYFANTLHGNVTSGFGYRNTTGRIPKNHTGIDIGAKQGSSIKAPIGGVVTKNIPASKSHGFGNVVAVKDKNNAEHYFGHMENTSNKKVGSTIKPGDSLGRVGSTGNSTGPHLHYEVRQNGQAVNPDKYLNNYGGPDNTNSGALQKIVELLQTIVANTTNLSTIVELINNIISLTKGGKSSNTNTTESNKSNTRKQVLETAKQNANTKSKLNNDSSVQEILNTLLSIAAE